jgi:hypothetical protein
MHSKRDPQIAYVGMRGNGDVQEITAHAHFNAPLTGGRTRSDLSGRAGLAKGLARFS